MVKWIAKYGAWPNQEVRLKSRLGHGLSGTAGLSLANLKLFNGERSERRYISIIIMKLAEALIERADLQKRVSQLKQRLLSNARVQEGDTPAENPAELIDELEILTTRLTTLIQTINRTNNVALLADGTSLADALAERDIIKLKHTLYRDLAGASTITQQRHRFGRSEIKFVSTTNVAEIYQKADELAKTHRDLDSAIQAVNWSTELLE